MERPTEANKLTSTCRKERLAMADTLDALGGKWKLIILRYLSNRPDEKNTFKKMQREIDGISAKMLAKELKELETNHLITRTVVKDKAKPIAVEYKITNHGLSVVPPTETIVQWGLDHRTKLR